ncbi:UNVERIFIED_CONTAM: hypothetical protein K2H54_062254 [Gekko kuhli]
MEKFAPFSLKRFLNCENQMAKEYGNVYTIWAGSLPVVVFSGFEAVKEAAVNHSADFDERAVTPFFEAMGRRSGIAFSNGHTWKQQRKFGLVTLRKLGLGKKGIEHKIHEEAYYLAQTFADAKRQPLDPAIPITNSAINVICALVFGHRYSLEDEEFLKLRDILNTFINGTATVSHLLYDLFPSIMKHVPGAHKRAIATRGFVGDFVMKQIQRHRVHGALHEPLDFTDYYLLQMEKSKKDPTSTYNEENLEQCIADLFGAGTETTTTTLRWAFLLMANYPDVQEKVQKEIDDVFGSSEFYSYQDRKKVPYTNAVIHEIQRSRYALFFGLPRQCSKDVNIFGFFIPKGATVIIDVRSVLLDPKKWETPEKFNPNQFLDKDGQFVENEAFLPFGAGARVCAGEQLASIKLFILFTRMLRAFTFQPPEGVKRISEEPVLRMATAAHPYEICAIPRNSGS